MYQLLAEQGGNGTKDRRLEEPGGGTGRDVGVLHVSQGVSYLGNCTD